MIKAIIISILIIVFSIQNLNAACYDTELYCFDSNNHRLGEIIVGQCWTWSRFNCLPFRANLMKKQNSFQNYVNLCREFYQDTVLVLDTKQVWTHRVLSSLNKITLG